MVAIKGQLNSTGLRLAIVASRFNELVVDRLVAGALDAISRTGGDGDDVPIFWAPGAFELPIVAKGICERLSPDGVVAIGAVVRGQTPHFNHVCEAVRTGLMSVQLETRVPCAFGVITADSLDQALERAGGKAGNKGYDAAMAAIETVNLLRQMARDYA